MKRLLPVIHILNEKQAVEQASLCNDLGLGCFLIHHRRDYITLFHVAEKVHEQLPDMWIGVNALDLSPLELWEKSPDWVKGIWVDNGGVVEIDGNIDTTEASEVQRLAIDNYREETNKKYLAEYFGGFAFKYQAPVTKLQEGAMWAALHFDTVTTSGTGTGIAADLEKVKVIRDGIDESKRMFSNKARLGLASGVSLENVDQYLPYVDDFLVSTSLHGEDEYHFDKDKVEKLRDKILNYEK